MNRVPWVRLAVAAVLLVAAGLALRGCGASERAEAADARADSLQAVSESLGRVRTRDSLAYVQDTARLSRESRRLEEKADSLSSELRVAEAVHHEAVAWTDSARASVDSAISVLAEAHPDEMRPLVLARVRELEAWQAERNATAIVVETLRDQTENMAALLAVRTEERDLARAELAHEQEFRIQETRRADGYRDARDEWRSAAKAWKLGTVGAAVAALVVAGIVVF